jgi:hypothetical protein
MQVVLVSRHPLALLPENLAPFVPAAKAVCDYYFVPKGPRGLDRGHIANSQVERCDLIADVRSDLDPAVGIENRLGARLDSHGRSHISPIVRFDLGILNEQCLPIFISFIDVDVPGCASGVGKLLAQKVSKWT